MGELKAGGVLDCGEVVSGVNALKLEAGTGLVEAEQRLAGQQRNRAADSEHAVIADARRADEVHLLDKGAGRVLLAEQDDPRHDVIKIGRSERAGPSHLRLRIVAGPHQVDVAVAVDLSSAEEKGVDTALSRAVEQLGRTIGEEVVLHRSQN